MRMWNINPKKMCNQHLLGEHVEMHMFAGCLKKRKNIQGYIDKGFVEIHNIKKRHAKLAGEMKKRNMNHKSPLIKFREIKTGKINKEKSYKELIKRCAECRNLRREKNEK